MGRCREQGADNTRQWVGGGSKGQKVVELLSGHSCEYLDRAGRHE